MTWAERRKLFYIFITLLIIGGLAYFVYVRYISVPPTCFDGRKNGDELAVDCGGSCALYCPIQVTNPKVLWARTFPMTQTVSHAIAMIEHNNITAAARQVEYTFTLYDEKNNVITERTGKTFIGVVGRTAIVETLIPTEGVSVARTTLRFSEPIAWEKIPLVFSQAVVTADRFFVEEYSYGVDNRRGTRLSATINNESEYIFSNFDAVAILYDKAGNALTTSKVLIPQIAAKSKRDILFTWPFSVSNLVDRVEVIPRINPFEVGYDARSF